MSHRGKPEKDRSHPHRGKARRDEMQARARLALYGLAGVVLAVVAVFVVVNYVR
jgi:hypothetical protein